MFYLQQLKVVQTVVNRDHHQLGEDILDRFLEALCYGLQNTQTLGVKTRFHVTD